MTFKKIIQEGENDNIVMDFVINSFHNITQFHIFHILTKNAPLHEALGEFYDSLLGGSDSFAEQYLGSNDLGELGDIKPFNFTYEFSRETIKDYLTSFQDSILKIRTIITDSTLLNVLDTINESANKLSYKLKMDQ